MIPKDPRHFLRPIGWSIALFLVLGLLLSQWLLPGDEQRWPFRFLLLALGAYWFAMTQHFMPRYWLSRWMVYSNSLVTILVIAISGYLTRGLDVSPLYMIVILATGMVWDRRAALFSATLASILMGIGTLAHGAPSSLEIASLALDVAGYYVGALLVTQLRDALTKRWQTATAQAEQHGAEISARKDELEGLYRIAQAFGNLEDAEATFHQVTEHIARFIGARICAIAMLNPESGQLQGMPPGYGMSDQSIRAFRFPSNDEDRAHPFETFKHDFVLFNDQTHLTSSIIKFAAVQNIRGFVTARMMLHGRPIGLILLANKISGGAFEEEDGRLLSILAGQAAIAIENVRLYRQAQENLVDMTRLYAISAQLASSSDPSEIPELVVRTLTDALNASSASIALLNESTGQLEYSAKVNLPDALLTTPFRENGVGMTVLRTGKARFIEDGQTANDVSAVARASGYRATACLPIQHGVHAWGILYVNYPEPHVFTPFEKNMLAIFANQVSIALENAKLLRAERRRLVELSALTNLSHSFAETMDLEEMFRVFEQQVCAEIPAAEGGALLMYDAVRDVLIPRASFGYDREIMQRVALHPGESAAGQVFLTNTPVILNGRDQVREARHAMRPDNQALFAAAASFGGVPQSLISAPLHAGGETLGSVV
ncbi:MAG TPA: GAF domain-containing protein, partial [Anaerolineae bacterium]